MGRAFIGFAIAAVLLSAAFVAFSDFTDTAEPLSAAVAAVLKWEPPPKPDGFQGGGLNLIEDGVSPVVDGFAEGLKLAVKVVVLLGIPLALIAIFLTRRPHDLYWSLRSGVFFQAGFILNSANLFFSLLLFCLVGSEFFYEGTLRYPWLVAFFLTNVLLSAAALVAWRQLTHS